MLNQEFVIKTLPSTFTEYTGPFPLDGNFDTGNGTNAYAGGTLSILKEHVFCNHKGEFWKGGQTNMFYHYHQSGLLLNIFGTTFPNSGSGINYDNPYQIGMAGNTFCIRTLQHKNHILLFTNDESYHGGVHIWKISRIEDFKMQYGKVKLLKNNGKVFLTPYTSSNFNPLKKVKGDFYVDNLNLNFTGNVFDILPAESTAFVFESFNITFPTAETYTIYIQTEAGFKLYMNDVSLIDQLNNDTLNEFSISTGLVGANTSKKIKIEYKGYKNAVFKMQWSSATISKQVIPLQYLFSLKPVNDFEKINLLEGLKRNEYISEYCGWKLTPQSPDLSKVYFIKKFQHAALFHFFSYSK